MVILFKRLLNSHFKFQIRNPEDETQCIVCDWGTLPNMGRTECLPIPEVYLRPDSGWAIGAMSFSSVGILLTSMVCIVLYKKMQFSGEKPRNFNIKAI